MDHATEAELDEALDEIRRSPADDGTLQMIVRRPAVDERDELAEAILDVTDGLVGDTWRTRAAGAGNGHVDPGRQITVMNWRVATAVAVEGQRRSLAGDQLYVDLDISIANLPPGTRLAIGSAVIEVSEHPHLGCTKFASRFGPDAHRFVNSPVGRELRLRGLNASIVVPGTVRVGQKVNVVPRAT
jgi:MOSC domain-containing protein YiiM